MTNYTLIALYLSCANLIVLGTIMSFFFIYHWVKRLIERATVDTIGNSLRDLHY